MAETEQTADTNHRPLFQPQRQDEITALAIEQGRVDVAELAARERDAQVVRREQHLGGVMPVPAKDAVVRFDQIGLSHGGHGL